MVKKVLLLVMVALLATACSGNKKNSKDTPRHGEITILHVNDFEDIVRNSNMRIIDVRTSHEYAEGHIERAENIDIEKPEFLEKLRIRKDIAVYCRSGKRSHKAALLIAEQGYNVYDLGGGFNAWQSSGKPVVR